MTEFVQAQLQARIGKLAAELARAVEEPHDAETVHDLRVATRRLAQCMKSFAQFLPSREAKKIRSKLSKLRRGCGGARDADITLELLEELKVDDPKLFARLRRERQKAERTLVKTLHRWKDRRIEERWAGKLPVRRSKKGPWNPKLDSAANSRCVLPKLVRELVAAGDRATGDGSEYETLHRFRIEAKHFRYTLELVAPLYDGPADVILRELKGLQDQLGAINDCVTAANLAEGHPGTVAAIERAARERRSRFEQCWREQVAGGLEQRWTDTLSATATAEPHHVEADAVQADAP